MEQFSLQPMSPSGPGAFEFRGVQNASESNGMVVKGTTTAEFGPGKPQTKTRFMKDLSWIKPQMMLKFLSSIDLSEDKKVNFAHVNRQAEGFNGQSKASSHAELMELFPLSTGFDTDPIVTETNLTSLFAIGLTDPNSRSVQAKASTTKLTIFYNGAVNVYDMPAEKAQAIMKLAGTNSSSNTITSPTTSGKIEQISQQQPSKTALNAVNENQTQGPPVDLEIVRKLSLRRFLQKRKDRFNSVAPYTTILRNDSDDWIIMSLGCPRGNQRVFSNAVPEYGNAFPEYTVRGEAHIRQKKVQSARKRQRETA